MATDVAVLSPSSPKSPISETAEDSAARTIRELKREIEERVPLFTTPMPVDELYRLETEMAFRQDVLQTAALPAGRGWRERLKAACKGFFCRLVRWLWMRQVEFNSVVVEYGRETARWNSLLEQNLQEVAGVLANLQRQTAELARRVAELSATEQRSHDQTAALLDQLAVLRHRLRRLAGHDDSALPTPDQAGATAPDSCPVDVFTLAQRLRGSRLSVQERQRVYLDLFKSVGKVVVLDCGRGEFLETLGRFGLSAMGVEPDRDLAEYCQAAGLSVTFGEADAALGDMVEGSLGGIFSDQLVDHSTPEQLTRLLALARARLHPGGLVVLEAVHPACPGTLSDFYLDPRRHRPVPPELLALLCEHAGLTPIEYLFTLPTDREAEPCLRSLEARPTGAAVYRHYAIVARRRG
jgi:O-antigen chain-terminating methyltransferase